MSRIPSPPATTLSPTLAIGDSPSRTSALAEALRAVGEGEIEVGTCLTLVQDVQRLAPRQVVCVLPQGATELVSTLVSAWHGAPPCAVCVFAPLPDEAAAIALADAGVSGWAPWLEADQLASRLTLARTHHAREASLRGDLAKAQSQLDERKWVDRAKGLLMAARSIAEDDAFRLLRGAAMHANLKLGDVSRSVIDAARWAEAVNRAGQLRMLSQRLVALAAQRLARVDAPRAKSLQAQAAQRVEDTLGHLSALTLDGDAAGALADVRTAWADLHPMLNQRLANDSLAACDTRAEALLGAADRLTTALEASGARPTLSIVNRCGSQRMRVQRLAKEALLATLLGEPARGDRITTTMTEFETVLAEIEAAPLSSPEIRAALAASREGWLTLLRALRAADVALLSHSSEALLDHLDTLTESCENSLQLLMS